MFLLYFKKVIRIIVLITLCSIITGCMKLNPSIIESKINNAYADVIAELGDVSEVTENITLPTTAEGGVTITWVSDKPSVISNEGIVTPQKEDTVVNLEATFDLNGTTKKYTITITVPGQTQEIEETYAVLLPNEDNGIVDVSKLYGIKKGETITIYVTPNTGYEVEWVKVNGQTVTLTNGQVSYTVNSNIEITVSFKVINNQTPTTYTVTLPTNANGTVTASKTSGITTGEQVTLTVTPKTGYQVEWVKVNGNYVALTDNQVVITVNENINVTVLFEERDSFYITIPTIENGKIAIDTTGTIYYGTKVTLTIIPNNEYELEWIKINDEITNVIDNKVTIIVNCDIVVTASFIKINQDILDDWQCISASLPGQTSRFSRGALSMSRTPGCPQSGHISLLETTWR